jgi:hypothetical protein
MLDADQPDTVRLTVAEAAALGERVLTRVGYSGEDSRIIVDQLVDNALCGYKFAGPPPHAGEDRQRNAGLRAARRR